MTTLPTPAKIEQLAILGNKDSGIKLCLAFLIRGKYTSFRSYIHLFTPENTQILIVNLGIKYLTISTGSKQSSALDNELN